MPMKPVHTGDHMSILAQDGGVFSRVSLTQDSTSSDQALRLAMNSDLQATMSFYELDFAAK